MAAGTCPHCGARAELAPAVFARERRCDSCRGAYVAVLPEGADAAGEIALLPLGRERRLGAWLERRRLRGPLFVWLLAFAAALLLLVVGGLLASVSPALTPVLTVAAAALFVLVGLLVTAVAFAGVAAIALFALSRGRVRDRDAFWRSVLALACGGIAFYASLSWAWQLGRWAGGGGWSLSLACSVLAGAVSGAVTARLAPSRPYRHAFGLALGCTGIAMGLGLIGVAFGGVPVRYALDDWIASLAGLPGLLAGCALGARASALAERATPA